MSDPAAPQSAGPAPARASVTHDTNALHCAAIEALQAGRIEEALEGLAKVVALNPRFLSVYNNMGVALYRLGRFEAAAAWYRRAMQLGDIEARGNLGDAYRKLGRLAEAEAC
ncbi:MAG: tetratricopeptide repeat protein [Alphaproteobacteria bacterium]|nr:tetratricopeptide repeat protein [Alphaproteobacteria bacterium]